MMHRWISTYEARSLDHLDVDYWIEGTDATVMNPAWKARRHEIRVCRVQISTHISAHIW